MLFVKLPRHKFVRAAAYVGLAAVAYLAIVVVLTVGGVLSPFPVTDISGRQPYADVIGREYRVVGNVIAVAWNDFPDKETLLSIALISPPGSANRFVSWTVPLKQGQVVRITGARRQFDWLGFGLWYVVSLPGMDWPKGVPVKIGMDSEGAPDPKLYELIHQE